LSAEALAAASSLTMLTDLATSLQLAEKAAEVAGGLGDDRVFTWSRLMLCLAYYFAGQPERARPLGAEAVERARKLGDDVLLGLSLNAYASTVGAAASGPLYVEALACAERSGDLFGKQVLHANASWDALEIGDIPGVRAHLEAAMRAAEAIGCPHHAESLNLGLILRAEHDLDSARSTLQEALRGSRRLGSKHDMAIAILGLACLAGDLGDWPRAAVLHGAAQALLDQTGGPWERFDARYRQESLDQADTALDDEQLHLAYAHGMTLSFDHAIDLALEGVPPST
jgi:tetratricopeptide (TPR) repeat protein